MQRYDEGLEYLAQQGLNLLAVFDCAALPDAIVEPLAAVSIEVRAYSRLVMFGNGGRQFWQSLHEQEPAEVNPVDEFSRYLAQQFLHDFLDAPSAFMLYPGSLPVPLQRLGVVAGWQHSSPLGIGINQHYGLWFAYRVAFLVDIELPVTEKLAGDSPCLTCEDKPCVSACPVQAVSADEPFAIHPCMDFRVQANSLCAEQCLSRLACPVAVEHRYDGAQIGHHYRHALGAMRQWQDGQS